MKKVEVFGMGCKKCIDTEQMIQAKAEAMGAEIDLQHIHDPAEIASRGIMMTPAVMVDGKLVHKGGLPRERDIEEWLSN